MKIKEFNGLNIINNKQLELILAIQSIYLKNNPNMKDEFDFIEVPPVDYINELEQVINSVNHEEIVRDLVEFKDSSVCIEIALGLNDNYEIALCSEGQFYYDLDRNKLKDELNLLLSKNHNKVKQLKR